MLLSDIDLEAEIGSGRLVFDPALEADQIQSASVDLSLHTIFWKPAERLTTFPIDPSQYDAYEFLDQFEADHAQLEPGAFILGETAEAVSIPQHLAGWVEGKSGRARHGLIVHCTAPHIAPGWGTPDPQRITLELVNHGHSTLELVAGEAIAQLMVLRLGSPSHALYAGRHRYLGT